MLVNKLLSIRGIKKITRLWAYPLEVKRVRKDLASLPWRSSWDGDTGNVTYIRSDLWLKNDSPNGAVAHTEGVVNALVGKGFNVNVFTPYALKFLKRYNSMTVCTPDGIFASISEIEEMEYSRQLAKCLLSKSPKPDFVYQRYGRNNYSGLMYARKAGVPLIIEYNGSEIWMSRNWGKPLRYEAMAEEIELAVLRGADLIVGNAQALKDELVSRGVEPERVLIIPNGVDPEKFNPSIDGSGIRKKLHVGEDEILVSFVGSFGPWHGAEVLAKAVKPVIEANPKVRFAFIGDGSKLQEVIDIINSDQMTGHTIITGLIAREEAPLYLAASDILVSPQIPNPDGTPFFGSPTKLFEYMAMGKAIIASDLDQIGILLTDKVNALLTEPGGHMQIAEAILKLASDKEERKRLGDNARLEAVEKYSWSSHVSTVINHCKLC